MVCSIDDDPDIASVSIVSRENFSYGPENENNYLDIHAPSGRPRAYGRILGIELWGQELLTHMISPSKKRSDARLPVTPKRKQMFKGILFHMYER